MSWKVAHACVRGSAHRRSGLPNQDAAQCTVTPSAQGTVAVAVVSDGHGSARHFRSQIGSSLAVSTGTSTLQEFMQSVSVSGLVPFVPEQVHELERRIVSVWLAAIHSDLGNNPFTEAEMAALEKAEGAAGRAEVEGSPELAYGATLLAAAATDRVLLCLQLGDGEILSVNAKGVTVRPLPPDDRLIGNQTTSLCQPEAWKDFRSTWLTDGALPALVLLSTDGYANSFRSDEDFLKIGHDYLEIIREQGIASLAEELPDILTEATQQGSGDDITLAILQDDVSPAAGTKTPRPLMTPASKSALIEQLKARHSSQQHKLQELTLRVEETRQDNRRLRNVLLLLLVAAIAIPAILWRGRFFQHAKTSPAPLPAGPVPGKKAVAHKAPVTGWRLRVGDEEQLLRKGSTIAVSFIHPDAAANKTLPAYAQVADKVDGGPLFLINVAGMDHWTVEGRKVEDVPLGSAPLSVVFAKNIKGTLTPMVDPPPREP